ncbi:hypothetical protein [Nocardia seriolae]|uniref:Uncharacterized protein n=1 Tax=Nocardia seriolae TaxID=37332 RepID=A0ABC9YRD7_9NOCA|nr:hypothetical protein [Nocardia seriolae]APA98217.1 hypothetical protein NS506_04169 [Nocardia seriolae]MTJ87929.1 hypothetical protein [Nocardia seriolae]MTK31920.1 hypothetical protein [Nocardia seriolae]MTK48497.1 hypothetical protein [Nocardia seriolae]OJF80151.1 hypothetical protein NS14008_14270 [Nocardia seriolae]
MAIGGGLTVAQSVGSGITTLVTIFVALGLLSEPLWFGLLLALGTSGPMCVSGAATGSSRR